MYRLVAMDLDKTLLDENGGIPDEVAERLRHLNTEGVHFALCTGRVSRSAEHYSKIIGGASIASFNGSYIRTEDGDVYTSKIPLALAEDVVDFCYDNDVYIQLYDGETILVDHYTKELETDHDIDFTEYRELGDLRKAELCDTPKLIALKMTDEVQDVILRMRERFPQLTMNNSSRYVIEIMPKGVDKGYGLSIIADALGIKKEETMAIGDSMNDLAMLEWAGLGVAVSNADDRLKAAADVVTVRPMSFGVLEILDRFFTDRKRS